MKHLFDAVSSLTAFVNTFNEDINYKNLNDMHQDLLETMDDSKLPAKKSSYSDDDNDNDNDCRKNENKEDNNVEDGNSTDTEQVHQNRNKTGLRMSVDDGEVSKKSEDDNKSVNSE